VVEHQEQRIRRRRWLVLTGTALLAIGGVAAAAGADGALTISPSSGVPGTSYDVDVTCGELPEIEERHTQDASVQMTIAPFGPDDVTEVSPSLWRYTGTAGTTDEEYSATCDGAAVGQGRFDAESPHLWFGPRPQLGPDVLVGRTTVEGTDCPDGTEAEVAITYAGDLLLTESAAIDAYGDWTIELPLPVGDTEYAISATCGDVTYDAIQATSTTTSTTSSIPTLEPPVVTAPPSPGTVPEAAPATAQPGTAGYTG
jgi:hypothetical protein